MIIDKAILYIDNSNDSKEALKVLNRFNVPILVDTGSKTGIPKPYVEYRGRMTQGLINITKLASRYSDLNNLDSIFNETSSSARSKTLKLTEEKRKTLSVAILSFLIGGIYIGLITAYTGPKSLIFIIIMLLVPVLLGLGFPYYWPPLVKRMKELANDKPNQPAGS